MSFFCQFNHPPSAFLQCVRVAFAYFVSFVFFSFQFSLSSSLRAAFALRSLSLHASLSLSLFLPIPILPFLLFSYAKLFSFTQNSAIFPRIFCRYPYFQLMLPFSFFCRAKSRCIIVSSVSHISRTTNWLNVDWLKSQL